VLGLTAVINIALNLALIPLLGLAGAALATSTSIVFSRLRMHRLVVFRLGVRPSVFSRLGPTS
jgi:O-antigen/teichoic acid export membrane protein